MALIIGAKHYPRTLQNIDKRIEDLDYLRRVLNLSNKPKAKAMQRSIERALVRYELIQKVIYSLLRYYSRKAREARAKRGLK